MRKYIQIALVYLLIALLVPCTATLAANYYVRPSSGGPYGTSSGADWNNAYNGLANIDWTGKTGGDTIWIAGGTYTTGLSIGASGTNDASRLVVKRATANDTECTSAAGWVAGFDSQVISEGSGITISSRDYITIDGQVSNGIRIHIPTPGYSGVWFNYYPSNHITLRYLQIEGKGYQVDFSAGANVGVYATSNYGAATDLLIEHCDIKYCTSELKTGNWDNITVQYNTLHHCDATDVGTHEDVWIIHGGNNLIFRYNICYLNAAEGFFVREDSDNLQVYGNLFYDSQYAISVKSGIVGTNWRIYNNTVADCSAGINISETTQTGEMANNLAYNSGFSNSSPGLTETTNINTSTDPFVNLAGKDFHLAAASAPINAGTDLGVNYHTDLDGNVFGADGTWDVGAYEYGGAPPVLTHKPFIGSSGGLLTVGGTPAIGAN